MHGTMYINFFNNCLNPKCSKLDCLWCSYMYFTVPNTVNTMSYSCRKFPNERH